jgi:hypothetical protein
MQELVCATCLLISYGRVGVDHETDDDNGEGQARSLCMIDWEL